MAQALNAWRLHAHTPQRPSPDASIRPQLSAASSRRGMMSVFTTVLALTAHRPVKRNDVTAATAAKLEAMRRNAPGLYGTVRT
jgi:hypothetical protein